MATDFDAIAEAIIKQHALDQDAEWLLSPNFGSQMLSAWTCHVIRTSISEHLSSEDATYDKYLEVILKTRVSSDELAFVRNMSSVGTQTPIGALAALEEFSQLAQHCMFAVVLRKLRRLVSAQ